MSAHENDVFESILMASQEISQVKAPRLVKIMVKLEDDNGDEIPRLSSGIFVRQEGDRAVIQLLPSLKEVVVEERHIVFMNV